MKTETPDRFWRVYGVVFLAGVVGALLLGAALVGLRPKVDVEAVVSEGGASSAAASAWWAFAPEDPNFSPW